MAAHKITTGTARMRYELFYWPTIQGRGEFVRLAFEDVGADYVDVAREADSEGRGVAAMMRLLNDATLARPPFAPPFVRVEDQILSHTANILFVLAPRLGLVSEVERDRYWAHQLQLSVTDFIKEVHNTHHPIGSRLYYDEQKVEAKRYTREFKAHRLSKYLAYFERVLKANGGEHMVGGAHSYVDLSMFQLVEGLRYAFPRAMAAFEPKCERLIDLHDRVAKRPNIARYLVSPRRLPFNEQGIFRRYDELDES